MQERQIITLTHRIVLFFIRLYILVLNKAAHDRYFRTDMNDQRNKTDGGVECMKNFLSALSKRSGGNF